MSLNASFFPYKKCVLVTLFFHHLCGTGEDGVTNNAVRFCSVANGITCNLKDGAQHNDMLKNTIIYNNA